MNVHTKTNDQGSLSKCSFCLVTAGFQSTILLGFLCCWYYGVMHFLYGLFEILVHFCLVHKVFTLYMTYFVHDICILNHHDVYCCNKYRYYRTRWAIRLNIYMFVFIHKLCQEKGGCRGLDLMVIGFTATYAISAYHH